MLAITLETMVGTRKKVQDFDSESLTIGVEHSQKVKVIPSTSDYGSKDCAFCPDPTAVSRILSICASCVDRRWMMNAATIYAIDTDGSLNHLVTEIYLAMPS
jgi:hypothetical protein